MVYGIVRLQIRVMKWKENVQEVEALLQLQVSEVIVFFLAFDQGTFFDFLIHSLLNVARSILASMSGLSHASHFFLSLLLSSSAWADVITLGLPG